MKTLIAILTFLGVNIVCISFMAGFFGILYTSIPKWFNKMTVEDIAINTCINGVSILITMVSLIGFVSFNHWFFTTLDKNIFKI